MLMEQPVYREAASAAPARLVVGYAMPTRRRSSRTRRDYFTSLSTAWTTFSDLGRRRRSGPARSWPRGCRTIDRLDGVSRRGRSAEAVAVYSALYDSVVRPFADSRCQQRAPGHGFRSSVSQVCCLYAVDAATPISTIDYFVSGGFSRGPSFRNRTKAAIKLHVGLDQAGHLPSFVSSATDGMLQRSRHATVDRGPLTWTFEPAAWSIGRPPRLSRFHVVSPIAGLDGRGVTFVDARSSATACA